MQKGEDYYVAECLEIAVVTQGRTLDETMANLKEAVSLHLEGEDPSDFDLVPTQKLSRIRDLLRVAHVPNAELMYPA